MNLIVSSIAFYPDHSGIPVYSSDFSFFACEEGHQVRVITGFPFYPRWEKSEEDRYTLFRKDKVGSIEIYRGYLYVPKKPTTLTRIIHEFSFFFSAFINFLRCGQPDCIVVFTTPVLLGLLGCFFKFVYKCKLVINVQDYQVEAAISLNMVKNSQLVKILSKIEKMTYKYADCVTSISDSMVSILKEKQPRIKNSFLWPNWIDIDKESKTAMTNSFRKKLNIDSNTKVVAYAGNIGLKQGLSILIDLSERYKDTDRFLFLVIGQGAGLENLKKYFQSKKQLNNVRFFPFLNLEEYKNMLLEIDAFFVSQEKADKDIYFPSKLLGIMLMKKIIILSAYPNSELFKVLSNNYLALVSNYGDLDKLDLFLDKIYNNDATLYEIVENAYDYTIKNFDRKKVLKHALQKIEGLT